MDDVVFDRLTRRLVLRGLTGGSLAALLGRSQTDAKKTSKRKRCKQKKRTFCAGRCCAKGQRCQHRACVSSCHDPYRCNGGQASGAGGNCNGTDQCFCSQTDAGASACVLNFGGLICSTLPACSSSADCAPGLICAACSCPDRKCFSPCPKA